MLAGRSAQFAQFYCEETAQKGSSSSPPPVLNSVTWLPLYSMTKPPLVPAVQDQNVTEAFW